MRAIAALLVFAAAATASAQERSDLFAGYSALVSDGDTFHGWHAAAAFGLSGRIALVADASGHGGTSEDGDDVSSLALMAGPRFAFSSGRIRPFLQVIGGVVRTRRGQTIFEVEIAEKSTDLGGAAGGGVDVGFGERWAARVAADFRVVRADGETSSDPRLSAGIAYRFGR